MWKYEPVIKYGYMRVSPSVDKCRFLQDYGENPARLDMQIVKLNKLLNRILIRSYIKTKGTQID